MSFGEEGAGKDRTLYGGDMKKRKGVNLLTIIL